VQDVSYVIGATVFGIPTMLWIYSIKITLSNVFKNLLVIVTILTQILFSSNFFLPSMLANSVGLLLVVLLCKEEPLTKFEVFLCLSLAFASIRLYETMVAFSIIGLALLFFEYQRKNLGISKFVHFMLIFLLAASAVSSLNGLLNPVIPQNLESGISLSTISAHAPLHFFLFITGIFFMYVVCKLVFKKRGGTINNFVFSTFLLAVVLYIMFTNFQIGPTAHWYLRGAVSAFTIGTAALIAGIQILKYETKMSNFSSSSSSSSSSFLALAAILTLVVTINSAVGWSQYLYLIENTVNRAPGVMSYGELHSPTRLDNEFVGLWSTTYLSIVLRYGPSAGVIQNPFPEQALPEHDANNLVNSLPIYSKGYPYWKQ
jgi:hypothetical protein